MLPASHNRRAFVRRILKPATGSTHPSVGQIDSPTGSISFRFDCPTPTVQEPEEPDVVVLRPTDPRNSNKRGEYLKIVERGIADRAERLARIISLRRERRSTTETTPITPTLSEEEKQERAKQKEHLRRSIAAGPWEFCLTDDGCYFCCPYCSTRVKALTSFVCHLLNKHQIVAADGVPVSIIQIEGRTPDEKQSH